jgi:hypothetical protein
VIDWVGVRIPDFTAPGPILAGPLEQLRRGATIPYFKPSRHYQHVCDCREPFALDAMVHLKFRYGRKNHKVEIIDAGQKTIDEMAGIITRLFQIDPWTLQVMRIDLAADVEGVPVPWFRDHAYVNRKQFSSRIEKSFEQELQFVAMGSALAQTIYAGKRPHLFRIYDKLAEWRIQLRKLERDYNRFNRGMEGMDFSEEERYYAQRIAPTFREYCRRFGYEFHPGNSLTRVERQVGGPRVPPELSKFGALRYAHELNPFTALKIIPGERFQVLDSPPEDVSIRNWLAAIGFETLKEHLGSAQLARQIVLRHGNNNGRRILESLARCGPDTRDSVTLEQIQESYRVSTLAQTSPNELKQVYLTPTYEREREIA